jgi:hypothetical protein
MTGQLTSEWPDNIDLVEIGLAEECRDLDREEIRSQSEARVRVASLLSVAPRGSGMH